MDSVGLKEIAENRKVVVVASERNHLDAEVVVVESADTHQEPDKEEW